MFNNNLFIERIRTIYNSMGFIPEDLEKFAESNSSVSFKELKNCLNNEYRGELPARLLVAFAHMFGCSIEYLCGVSDQQQIGSIKQAETQPTKKKNPLTEREQLMLATLREAQPRDDFFKALLQIIESYPADHKIV